MTAKNRASSHKFAAERGLPTFDHVLIPRVKGFQFLVNALPDIMRKMVDVTVGYHKGVVDHSFLWTGKFDIECIRVYTRVDDYSIVPKNKEECSAFLMERFKQKDDLLAHLQQHDEFPAAESRNLRMYTLAPAHFMQFFLYGLALASVCAFTLCEECALLTAAVLTGLNMYTVADGFYTHRANLERFKSSGSPSMKRVRAKKSD